MANDNPYSDSFYSSQANTNANDFGNSVNPMSMNSAWGINPSMMTPSFAASYRPGWNGSAGQSNYTKPGFFAGAAGLGPWNNYPGHSAPQDNWDRNAEAVVENPASMAAFIAQRIAAPLLAYRAAGMAFGPKSFMGAFRGEGMGAAMGQGAFRGFATGVGRGLGMGAIGAGRLGMAAGVAGSAIGAFALPYAATQIALEGMERVAFNPFINSMETAESLRNNFAGVTFSDAQGSTPTGRGFGYKEAMGMSHDITHAGIKDMMFSTSEYKDVADMAMRSGMLDNNSKSNMTRGIKEIAEQVKLIVGISKDPNLQTAIEALSKLQTSGVSGANAGRVYSQLGMRASQAGASIQKMMETVGTQGEYLFRQNGMTPYQGQLAAATSYSSFAAANRMGLISPDQMARLGGLDGATQASLTGQVNASQTMYNKFDMYNKYLGKGGANGVIGTVSQFAHSMAGDPLGTYGAMQLYGGQMAGKFVSERGAAGVEEQLMAMVKNGHQNLLDESGKITAEKATPLLMNMDMNMDQIHAFFQERMNDTSPEAIAQKRASAASFQRDQIRTIIDQNGAYGGWLGSSWNSMQKAGRNAVNNLSPDWASDAVASGTDSVMRFAENAWFGNSIGHQSDSQLSREDDTILHPMGRGASTDTEFTNYSLDADSVKYDSYSDMVNNIPHNRSSRGILSLFSEGDSSKDAGAKKIISRLNELAKTGNIDAQAAVRAIRSGRHNDPSISKIRRFIINEKDSGLNEVYKSSDDLVELDSHLEGAQLKENAGTSDVARDVNTELENATGLKGPQALGILGDTERLLDGGLTLNNYDTADFTGKGKYAEHMSRVEKAYGVKGQDLVERLKDTHNKSDKVATLAATAEFVRNSNGKTGIKDFDAKFAAAGNDDNAKAVLIEQLAKQVNSIGHVLDGGYTGTDDKSRNQILDTLKQSAQKALVDSTKSVTELSLQSYKDNTQKLQDNTAAVIANTEAIKKAAGQSDAPASKAPTWSGIIENIKSVLPL